MMEDTIILKFGGSSVADNDKLKINLESLLTKSVFKIDFFDNTNVV